MQLDKHLEVSVGLSQAILETARSLGVTAPDTLLQAAGIDPSLLLKPENRIAFERQQALWILAYERCANPNFCLHFARIIQPNSYGLLGYVAMNCHTINDSFDAIVKYQFLTGQGGEFILEKDREHTSLSYVPVNPDHEITHQRVVAMLGGTVSYGRWLVGASYRASYAEFTHESPPDSREYEEFFGCPIRFGASRNCLVYPASVGELNIPNASEELLQLLSERADRLMKNMAQHSGLARRVASLLATQLTRAMPEKPLIAAQLGMSERTLQRRLNEEGTSYQKVLEDTRHQLALELLRNTPLPINTISQHLGFSEPSTFYRAFKKWEGVTPGALRAEQQ